MSQKPHVNGVAAAVFKPDDITMLCPGRLASVGAISPFEDCPRALTLGACPKGLALGACSKLRLDVLSANILSEIMPFWVAQKWLDPGWHGP